MAGEQQKLHDLSDQWCALVACLLQNGTVDKINLETQVHRQRFERARWLSHWTPDPFAALPRILSISHIGEQISSLQGDGFQASNLVCKDMMATMHRFHVKLCIVGGTTSSHEVTNRIQLLDPVSGLWGALPQKLRLRGDPITSAVLRGRVYLCGLGFGEQAGRILSFNPLTADRYAWKILPLPTTPRTNCAVAGLAGKLYLCGGNSTENFEVLRTVECFDPSVNGCWEQLPPMREMRKGGACTHFKGQLLICGGNSSNNSIDSIMSSVEVYNLALRRWTVAPCMSTARDGHCVVTIGTCVYVSGVYSPISFPNALCSTEQLAFGDTSWVTTASMSVPRAGAAVALVGNKICIFGGCTTHPDYTQAENSTSVECFDVETNVWEIWNQMPVALRSHAVCAIAKV